MLTLHFITSYWVISYHAALVIQKPYSLSFSYVLHVGISYILFHIFLTCSGISSFHTLFKSLSSLLLFCFEPFEVSNSFFRFPAASQVFGLNQQASQILATWINKNQASAASFWSSHDGGVKSEERRWKVVCNPNSVIRKMRTTQVLMKERDIAAWKGICFCAQNDTSFFP